MNAVAVPPPTIRHWAQTRATVPISDAARALGVSAPTARRSVRDGTFPVPVMSINTRMVVSTRALADALGIDVDHDTTKESR